MKEMKIILQNTEPFYNKASDISGRNGLFFSGYSTDDNKRVMFVRYQDPVFPMQRHLVFTGIMEQTHEEILDMTDCEFRAFLLSLGLKVAK